MRRRTVQADRHTVSKAYRSAKLTKQGGTASRSHHVVRFVALVVVSAIIVIYAIVVWTVADDAIYPPRGPATLDLHAYPDLHPITMTWRGAQDAHLVGHLFAGRNKATIVLSHGYGNNEGMMLPWAQFLHKAGFTVVTYSMRGRGSSTGAVTLGALESRDLALLVDNLSGRTDVDGHRIGVLGVSLGGSVSIMAAAVDQRIRAVVDDCGFSDAQHVVNASFSAFTGVPTGLFAGPVLLLAQWRTGISIRDISPVSVVSRIAPRPLLIIHGTADRFVTPDNSIRLYAAARFPKTLWWVSGAPHASSYTYAPREYERHVIALFQSVFSQAT